MLAIIAALLAGAVVGRVTVARYEQWEKDTKY